MPKTAALKHVHKYYRLESTGLWHCALCSHYKPGNVPPPVWSQSRCWKCEKHFELNPDNMRNSYPTCGMCDSSQTSVDDLVVDYIDYKTTTFDKPPLTFDEYKRRRGIKSIVEKDEIEVIEADEPADIEHSADCGVYRGSICTCGRDM